MPSISSNGISLEYDERGSGDPLLLVMGLGGQMIAWRDDFCDLLAAEGFRVIRFDNRDVGLSTTFDHLAPPPTVRAALAHLARRPLTPPYTLDDMADDAVGLLDELGIESAHVVGASLGGMIAQLMTLNHPRRVRSLSSLMSTTGNRKVGQPSLRVLAELVRRARGESADNAVEASTRFFELITGPHFDADEHRRQTEEAVARSFTPAGTVRQAAAVAAAPDRTDRLRGITVPTLVVHGERDRLIDPSGGRATAAAIPGAELLVIDDLGHSLPRALWPRVIDAIAANARSREGAEQTS